jgi:DNA-binding transcriptional LysR family regulator
MRLDPVSLRLFLAAAEEGTIAAAAYREHIATAALSKRLGELEFDLRTQLLVRTNKGVVPTAAGAELLGLARGVLHDLDEIYVRMRDYASGVRGLVRVFANVSAITQFLPGEMMTFMSQYPLVQVLIEEKISTSVTRGVAENAADIGIFAFAAVPTMAVEVFPYHADELVVIAPADHPLSRDDETSFERTLEFDYVGHDTGSVINLLLLKVASEMGKTLRMRLQVTSFDAMRLMVSTGLGIAILPRGSVTPYLSGLRIKPLRLNEPWAKRELKLCVRNYRTLSVSTKILFDHLLKSGAEA